MGGTKEEKGPFTEGPANGYEDKHTVPRFASKVKQRENILPVSVIVALDCAKIRRRSYLLKSMQPTFFMEKAENVKKSFLSGLSPALVFFLSLKSGVIR